jgi:hypothetical protein
MVVIELRRRPVGDVRLQAEFPPVAASAGEAREMARQALVRWGLNTAEEKETTLLLLTELISNGVRHANTELSLLITYDGSLLHVGVSDHDSHLPPQTAASPDAHQGWGLRLVSILSSEWGTSVNTDGKTVWFELNVQACPSLRRNCRAVDPRLA